MGRVLILDSDAIIAGALRKKFIDSGFEVVVCDDAQDAILQIDSRAPSVIVLEIANRQNSGVDFLYELRSYIDWQFLPVIVYTRFSETDKSVLADGLTDVGVSAILRKADVTVGRLVEIASDMSSQFATMGSVGDGLAVGND
ncbi:response regulator [Candidatus Saccharibacteria bacterium]|nr:response regulator [Candidatus Saccharibacteria bacterium]